MSQQTTIQTVLDYPLVPVFFHPEPAVSLAVLNAAYSGGVRAFEFTNRGANALTTFQLLAKHAKTLPDYIVGAGTVFKETDAEAFIEAGAAFIVSPCFVETVADVCYQNKIPYMPGCMTVKEVFYATEAGCEILKVFPGEVLGTLFVKAVTSVMPFAKLMVTGGVTPHRESIRSWFDAGASAVGLGSQLFKKELLDAGNYHAIETAVANSFRYLK